MATMKNFIVSSRINYVCIAPSQSKFILPDLPIAVNFSKYCVSCVRVKKCLIAAFMKMNSS